MVMRSEVAWVELLISLGVIAVIMAIPAASKTICP
jgi:hypothetical protein